MMPQDLNKTWTKWDFYLKIACGNLKPPVSLNIIGAVGGFYDRPICNKAYNNVYAYNIPVGSIKNIYQI